MLTFKNCGNSNGFVFLAKQGHIQKLCDVMFLFDSVKKGNKNCQNRRLFQNGFRLFFSFFRAISQYVFNGFISFLTQSKTINELCVVIAWPFVVYILVVTQGFDAICCHSVRFVWGSGRSMVERLFQFIRSQDQSRPGVVNE